MTGASDFSGLARDGALKTPENALWGLKLKAVDADDLSVLSTCLQDAALPIGQMTYDRTAERFGLVVSRFMWEVPASRMETSDADGAPDLFPCAVYQRIQSRVWFEQVEQVSCRGIDHARRDDMLELLALTAKQDGNGKYEITVHFADGKAVRMVASRLRAYLEDVGDPWPTTRCPQHGGEAG